MSSCANTFSRPVLNVCSSGVQESSANVGTGIESKDRLNGEAPRIGLSDSYRASTKSGKYAKREVEKKETSEPITLVDPFASAESKCSGEATAWRTQGVKDGAQALQDFILNPNLTTAEDFERRLNELQAEFPNGNIMDVLMLVFMESIKDMNEDKKYFLKKLMMYNKMGEGLAKYLQEVLLPASDKLGNLIAQGSSEDAGSKMVEIEIREHDTTSLSESGEIMTTDIAAEEGKEVREKRYGWFGVDCFAKDNVYQTKDDRVEIGPDGEKKVYRHVNQMSLGNRIKGLEAEQETVRNKRQMASTAFQNFDQKTNQLYNLLSSVLKGLGEMRMGTTRNML